MNRRSSPIDLTNPGTQLEGTALDKLITVARGMRVDDMNEAQGTCLARSLNLCVCAESLGVGVKLVMWEVYNDRRFFDHWAVKVSDTQVIDLTYIQVNAQSGEKVLCSFEDYPDNFRAPRFYETTPLIIEYKRAILSPNKLLPSVLFKRLRRLMLSQDLSRAAGLSKVLAACSGLKSYVKFRFYFWMFEFGLQLQARLEKIQQK